MIRTTTSDKNYYRMTTIRKPFGVDVRHGEYADDNGAIAAGQEELTAKIHAAELWVFRHTERDTCGTFYLVAKLIKDGAKITVKKCGTQP